ncbi:hypothetical protein T492DRAFT_21002 [Pavlovales sp. CCMP2436]|nr:hypothetical protein T492DRAFT_21002 [Pavlovales sp. CCMP2436]
MHWIHTIFVGLPDLPDRSRSVPGALRESSRSTSGVLWERPGNAPGGLRDRSRSVPGAFPEHFESPPGVLRERSGITPTTLIPERSGRTPEVVQDRPGSAPGALQESSWSTSRIFPQNFGISRDQSLRDQSLWGYGSGHPRSEDNHPERFAEDNNEMWPEFF